MYADYAFYTSSYGSSYIATEAEFKTLERQAALHIDLITFNRLHNGWPVTDAVKNAVCAAADVLKKHEASLQAATTAAGLKSENNDGYSVSYQDAADIKAAVSDAMTEAATPYLVFTGLMDRSACL